MFYALSNEVEIYRNGNRDNPRDRVLYREFSRIGRNGALTERIVKDIPTGSIGYAAIIPKEDDFLEFECPHFIELGDSRRFLNIEVSRPMVRIKSGAYVVANSFNKSRKPRGYFCSRSL
ncbi:hypothetical protein JJV77_10770 [Klebsiella pneumoniae]|uniref:hypothetical protein n=1 Tax=Klebsiella pneumoniae TaxID=573 RepID=UPI001A8C9339|nr:hypothetical protein [Klebsiella pneumoniae]QSS32039.1 hypothetical protein JJV77_10770 [Klebsiella pneumoniae]